MTHDELLAKIDRDHEYWSSIRRVTWTAIPEITALRAVVEMHYPWEITWAVKQPFIACYSCAEEYPCPTIETIIEELK